VLNPSEFIYRCGRRLRYHWFRLKRIPDQPGAIARGFSIGVFTGCFPLFGMQTLLALLLAIVLRGNKLCAAAGTWISNPFTSAPLYWLNFQIGAWVLSPIYDHTRFEWVSVQNTLQNLWELSAVILTGSTIVGALSSLVTYLGLQYYLKRWRSRLHQRAARLIR